MIVDSQSESFPRTHRGVSEWLVIISALLIAFPFLKILPLSAEVQPLFLVSIFMLAIVRLRVRRALLIYLAIFIIPLSLGVFFYSITAVVASLVAIATPIFLYELVRGQRKVLVARVILASSIFYLLMAFMQAYLPVSANNILLGPMKFLIPRMTLSPLSDWDRGISIIASEPSTMAPMIFMVFAASIVLSSRGYNLRVFHPAMVGAACLFMIFQTKALTSFVLLFVFFISISLYYVLQLKLKTLFSVLIGSLALGLVIFPFFTFPERLTTLLDTEMNAESLFIVLDTVSSSRLVLSMGPFCNLVTSVDYTFGLGAWSEHSYEVSRCLSVDYADSERYKITGGDLNGKPPSIISLLLLDVGPVAISILALFACWLLQAARRSNEASSPWPLAFVLTSLFFITVGGFPLTIPGFWVTLFLFVD